MAPEQVEGKPPTTSFDIYALGVVIFEMLTARKPFSGPTALSTALERLQSVAPNPSDVLPSLPPKWDAIVAECMARDPRRRFASVDAIAASLAMRSARVRAPRWRTLAWAALGMAAAVPVLAVMLSSKPSASASSMPSTVSGAETPLPLPSARKMADPPPHTEMPKDEAPSITAVPSAAVPPPRVDPSPPVPRSGKPPKRPAPLNPSVAPPPHETPRDELAAPPSRPRHADDVINPYPSTP